MTAFARAVFEISPGALGTPALLLLDPGLSELKNFAPTIVLCGLIIWGVIKLAPTWKEVKMRELDIREKEIAQREQQSVAIQSLAEVTRDIAIEQKHATEALRIAERVNIREGEKQAETVRDLTGRVEAVEAKSAPANTAAAEARLGKTW